MYARGWMNIRWVVIVVVVVVKCAVRQETCRHGIKAANFSSVLAAVRQSSRDIALGSLSPIHNHTSSFVGSFSESRMGPCHITELSADLSVSSARFCCGQYRSRARGR